MVDKYFQFGCALALAMACTVASAAPTSLAATGLSGAGLSAQFDSGNGLGDGAARVASTSFTLDGQTAQALSDSDAAQARRQVQSLPSAFAADAGSTAALQLQLWNLVASVHAQQVGNQFDAVVATSTNIDTTVNDLPAAVPLPSATWLFLGGLAAVAAMQWRVRRRTTMA